MKERQSGVLMHISSLPGKYGIGSFGKSAYDFVDFLVRTKQRTGKFCLWARPVMEILLTNHSLHLREIHILLILIDWLKKDCL